MAGVSGEALRLNRGRFRSGSTIIASLASCVLGTGVVTGQSNHPHPGGVATVPADLLRRPLAIHSGIGSAHEPVTTVVDQAQRYYDQGLAYLHSFVWIDAARSFHEALRLDPDLAMADLGLSYALGGLGAISAAEQALEEARRLSTRVSARERTRIQVRAAELSASAQPGSSRALAEYRSTLNSALDEYPGDVELLLLLGHAQASTDASVRQYEKALKSAPDYFAAHHYLIHAYESANDVERALQHAEAFVRLAPAIPHAHHMYGHVLRRVSRMSDAINAFRTADDISRQNLTAEGLDPQFDWQYHHNLDLLGASYLYLGQTKAAEPVLRQSFQLNSIQLRQELNKKAWPAFLLKMGRSEEALQAANTLIRRDNAGVRVLGHVIAGRVMMATKGLDTAAAELARTAQAVNALPPDVRQVILPDLWVAQGELLLRTSNFEKGRSVLRRAVAVLSADPDPDTWIQATFELERIIGAAYQVQDWAFASEMVDQMGKRDDAYAGTHYLRGLLAERTDPATAIQSIADAIARWQNADAGFGPLADARARLAALNARLGRHAK